MNATNHDTVLSHLLQRYGVAMTTADIADAMRISVTSLHQRVHRHQSTHSGTDAYLPVAGRISRGQWSTAAVARWLVSFDDTSPTNTHPHRKPGRPRRHAPVAGGAA